MTANKHENGFKVQTISATALLQPSGHWGSKEHKKQLPDPAQNYQMSLAINSSKSAEIAGAISKTQQ